MPRPQRALNQTSSGATIDVSTRSSPLVGLENYPLAPESPLLVVPDEVRGRIIGSAHDLTAIVIQKLPDLYKRHHDVVNVLRRAEMDPLESYPHIDPKKDVRNITIHCALVALGAKAIAERLAPIYLNVDEIELVEKAGLGHDLNKKDEIKRRDEFLAALKPEADIASAVYSEAAYLHDLKLRQETESIDPTLLEFFKGSGSNTGHLSIQKFLGVSRDGTLHGVNQANITGLILNVVDALAYSTKPQFVELGETAINVFLPADERMVASKFYKPPPEGYPWMWNDGLASRVSDGNLLVEEHKGTIGADQERLGHYAYLQSYLTKQAAAFLLSCMQVHYLGEPDAALAQYLTDGIARF